MEGEEKDIVVVCGGGVGVPPPMVVAFGGVGEIFGGGGKGGGTGGGTVGGTGEGKGVIALEDFFSCHVETSRDFTERGS